MNIDDGLFWFTSDSIESALHDTSRIYLSGELKRPQPILPHLDKTKFEMGISEYSVFAADEPHRHLDNFEFNYIASGETHIMSITARIEYVLLAGSAFIIRPGTAYASKHKAGTRVVFFKAPGGNDKQLIDIPPEVISWMKKKI